jgi:hypothetical protein
MWAAMKNHLEVVKCLAQAGADKDKQNMVGVVLRSIIFSTVCIFVLLSVRPYVNWVSVVTAVNRKGTRRSCWQLGRVNWRW